MTPFIVMAKPVGSACNMRCSYCYYLGKDSQRNGMDACPERYAVMPENILDEMIRQIITSSEGPVVNFSWHGGEPTLAGIGFYQTALRLERKYLPPGWQARNNIQTNGLELADEFCAFLADNHFDVGVSIDGTPDIHNANRHTVSGGATWERAAASVRRLLDHGIEPDILCTVNAAASAEPEAVMESLAGLGSTWIQFIPVVIRAEAEGMITSYKEHSETIPEAVQTEGRNIAVSESGTAVGHGVSPQAYGEFLCGIFDEWYEKYLGKVDVQIIAETARILAGGRPALCWMSRECGRVPVVEKDGSVYSCDHFVDPEHLLGNIMKTPLAQLAGSKGQLEFGKSKAAALTSQCRKCRWLELCGGGCLKDRFALSRDGECGHYYLCEGLEMFFAHAVPVLEELIARSRSGA